MYYVLLVESCEPKTLQFKTENEVSDFLIHFMDKYGSLDDGNDNWVDQIFEGRKVNFSMTVKLASDNEGQVVS